MKTGFEALVGAPQRTKKPSGRFEAMVGVDEGMMGLEHLYRNQRRIGEWARAGWVWKGER